MPFRETIGLLLFCLPLHLMAQGLTIDGKVHDNFGQPLPGANVLVLPDSVIRSASTDGKFSAAVIGGPKRIVITYTGFSLLETEIYLRQDTTIAFRLSEKSTQLKEVVIDADKFAYEEYLQSTRSGTNRLTSKDIRAIPVLGGEADLIKTLQLLPGTIRGVEGSADLFVRGGAADQNLVLLDDAPIYNTSHLFGFLSVFNPDILSDVEAINGAFPAQYGGRLSSILNVNTRHAIPDKTSLSADIGLIASRLFIEQPIVKGKAGFWISGRRTYIDRVVSLVGEELPYFFYDLNGKLILSPSKKDKVEASYYGGDDILDLFRDRNNDGRGFLTTYASGNSSQSVRWQHNFDTHWKSSLSVVRTSYRYRISNAFEENTIAAFSDIEDYGAKVLFSNDSISGNQSLKIGIDWTRHRISPNIIATEGSIAQLLESSSSNGNRADEGSVFVQHELPVADRLKVSAGLRTSVGIVSGRNYLTPEPRFALRYALARNQAIKLSYSRMAQYMHRISNSAISTPTDVWYPVTRDIRPQKSHQVSAAWQRYAIDDRIYVSTEIYYKTMRDLVGYEEGTNLFFNTDFESKLIQGKGDAYGVEFLLRKDAGKLTGWISYTLSWSWRKFDGINNGDWFRARYDRRHNGALVVQYALGKRWAVSGVWEFISGSRFTPVIGQYTVLAPTMTGIDLIPIYSKTNAVKLADSHRLDLGIKFMSKPGKRFRWQWFAGVYNVYNRATPIGILIEQNETDGSLRYLQPGLFGTLPFISYGFKL